MRRLIVLLVFANLLLFAWGRGWFAAWLPAEREPQLLREQINAERVRVLRVEPVTLPGAEGAAAGEAGAAADLGQPAAGAAGAGNAAGSAAAGAAAGTPTGATSSSGATAAAGSDARNAAGVCLMFAALDEERARRLREALESAGAAVSAQRSEQGGSYLVYVQPAESMADAQRRLADLRRVGLTDMFLMQDGPFRLGISLGLFRTEEAARTLVSRVAELGVPGVRIAARPPLTVRVRLQARWPDARGAAAATALAAQFDAPARDCAAVQPG
ncbi:MAG: SPOR domain-containing protein [Burkholderiales bacterium]|nr:SPOR domain-containing protein [Burkholderiales bacterium]